MTTWVWPSGGVPLCRLSSRVGGVGFVECPVFEHCVEDVAASAGETYQGLVVPFAFCDLAVVVGAGGRVAQRGEGGEEEGALELLVSTAGGCFAANGAAGAAGDGRQPGVGGEVGGGGEAGGVAGPRSGCGLRS